MDIRVDNEVLGEPPGEVHTLGDLLAHVGGDDPDRLVVGIRLDGRDLAGDAIDEHRAVPLDRPGRLELQTASARKLAADTLGQAVQALEGAREEYERIAERLAAGDASGAMGRLGGVLDTWAAVEKALRQAAAVGGIDLQQPLAGQSPPTEMIDTLRTALGKVQQAVRVRDHVAVGDLIGYDMPEITGQWQCTLADLQQDLLQRE